MWLILYTFIYPHRIFRNLFNLVTHHDERKPGDCFHRSLLVVMLLRCLKKLGYFGTDAAAMMAASEDQENDVLSDDEAFIGGLLFHFLEVLQFNAHEVAQFEMIARFVAATAAPPVTPTAALKDIDACCVIFQG